MISGCCISAPSSKYCELFNDRDSLDHDVDLSPTSYIYQPDGEGFLFDDPHPDLPGVTISAQEVLFTVDKDFRTVVCWRNAFYPTLRDLGKDMPFPDPHSHEMLVAIAKISNYLAEGDKFQVVPSTVEEKSDHAVEFYVRNQKECCLVLSKYFQGSDEIEYNTINDPTTKERIFRDASLS